MNIIEKITTSNRTNIVVGFILIVAIIGIIILSTQAFVKSNSDENTIKTLQNQIADLESQVLATKTQLITLSAKVEDAEGHVASTDYQQESDIALLEEGLAQANNNINALNNQVSSFASILSRLQSEVSRDSASISSIEAELSSINSYLSSFSSTITSLQTKLNSLENTVNSLNNTIKYLISPGNNPAVLLASQPVNQGAGAQTLLYTFTPSKSGYISFSGVSNSAWAYIRIANNTTTASQNYPFGTGTTFSVPITAGYSYSIIFGNTASSGTVTATVTAVYYY
jgi:uncharacterized coiled-coil protein SlyX